MAEEGSQDRETAANYDKICFNAAVGRLDEVRHSERS